MRNNRESTWENTSERAGVISMTMTRTYYADLEDEHQQSLGGGSDEAGDSLVNR